VFAKPEVRIRIVAIAGLLIAWEVCARFLFDPALFAPRPCEAVHRLLLVRLAFLWRIVGGTQLSRAPCD